jgi:hypothetical protein
VLTYQPCWFKKQTYKVVNFYAVLLPKAIAEYALAPWFGLQVTALLKEANNAVHTGAGRNGVSYSHIFSQ